MKNYLLILSFAFLFTGCSPSSNSDGTKVSARPQFSGDLTLKIQKLYGDDQDDQHYACDKLWKTRIIEVATAIEEHRSEILQINKAKIEKNKSSKTVKLNNYDFIDSGPHAEYPDSWAQDRYSWKEVIATYELIKNDPQNVLWARINSVARSLVVDDTNRIVNMLHPGVRRLEKEKILAIFEKVKNCQLDQACISLRFSTDEESWLNEGLYYSYFIANLKPDSTLASAHDIPKRRRMINFIFKGLDSAASIFSFEKNNDFSVENGVLIVPLNLSVFDNDYNIFVETLEKTWSVLGLKVHVINSNLGYTVKIDDVPSERAYVSRKKKIMQLFSPTRLTTIKHEFGHILGLTDTYFTSFNQSACEYIVESNDGDIMSSSQTGAVRPIHINAIKEAYGIQ